MSVKVKHCCTSCFCPLFKWSRRNDGDLTRASCARVPPLVLLGVRATLVAYLFAVHCILWADMAERRAGVRGYRFFTQLSFVSLWLCELALTILSFYRRPWRDQSDEPIAPAHRCVSTFLWIAFETMATSAVFLDLIYWLLLYPLDPNETFVNLNVHGVNSLVVFIEMGFNRITFLPIDVLLAYLWPAVYMTFAWIYFAATGKEQHIYPFLDTRLENKAIVAGNYIGIPLGFALIFFALFAIDWLKRRFCCQYSLAASDEHADGWDGFSDRDVDMDALSSRA